MTMTQISVTHADEQPLCDQYAAPTVTLDGRSQSRRVSPDGFSLWLVVATMEPAARLRWDGDHGDEALFVKAGSLRVGDRSCPEGGVVVVESGVTAEVDVVEPTNVVHFGPTTHVPASGGEKVHVIGPRGYLARQEPTHATRQYANSTCPSCRINLFQSS